MILLLNLLNLLHHFLYLNQLYLQQKLHLHHLIYYQMGPHFLFLLDYLVMVLLLVCFLLLLLHLYFLLHHPILLIFLHNLLEYLHHHLLMLLLKI